MESGRDDGYLAPLTYVHKATEDFCSVFRGGELGAAGRVAAGAEAGGDEEAQAVENLSNIHSSLVVQRPTQYLTVFGTSSCTN
jgi:hypothetical protein